MKELYRQIQLLLPKEKQFLHQIYTKTIQEYAYIWEEFEDIEKLRKILLFIVKLFYIEHKGLRDLSQFDQEKFKKSFRELLTNHDALLQKTKKAEIREIEGIGIEEWMKEVKRDIMTINKIIEEYEKLPQIVRIGRSIRYNDLSWKIPRTTLDLICAYIQYGFRFTSSPPWQGLLDPNEKKEFMKYKKATEDSFKEKPTPIERVEAIVNLYRKTKGGGAMGVIFQSKAFNDSTKKSIYEQDRRHARLSFSLNIGLAYSFLDWMVKLMFESILSDIPVKLKMFDIFPDQQGSGENAHLYFCAANEAEVYKILTEYLYPTMMRYKLNAPGGRFLMVPIKDKKGNILKGVEFGQGLYKREDLRTPLRDRLLDRSNDWATSQFIHYVITTFSSQSIFENTFEKFKEIYTKKGRMALVNDKIFSTIYLSVRQKLIELGRDPNYPILDRDARKIFPNFTKLLA